MEEDFFEGLEKTEVRITGGSVELPILYRESTCVTGVFTVPAAAVRELLPTPDLVPLPVWPGRSLLGFSAFSYRDTSIGPYNEFAIGIPVRYKPSHNDWPMPALRMAATLSFDIFIWKLPVTSEVALNAGIDIWGYPKFLADIDFEDKIDAVSCRVVAEGKHILTFSVRKMDAKMKTYLDLNSYTVKDGNILWTPVRGISTGLGRSFKPGTTHLELGDHPLAAQIGDLGISKRSATSLYIPNLQTILPAAEKTYPL